MLIISGGIALSPFRIEKKLLQIQKHVPSVKSLSAHFVYFVECFKELSKEEQRILEELVGMRPPVPLKGEAFLVIPRAGTISPWSSKATDIANNIGLTSIARLERGIHYSLDWMPASAGMTDAIAELLHDRMTEAVVKSPEEAKTLFLDRKPAPVKTIPIETLKEANQSLGLALSAEEMDYLTSYFTEAKRAPTDVELMMFAQLNSEHCRHKIFKGQWIIDSKPQGKTLFEMIQNTYQCNPHGILSAYSDNAAVLEGSLGQRFFADAYDHTYRAHAEPIHIQIKVETHNHPTAVSPFPGAATGSGGEIRDEGAVGTGSKPKAGLAGFSVSHLLIPGFEQPWEENIGKPHHLASALDIMTEGPIGAASFNNEFGRPQIAGYFRTFLQGDRGYHKPIMIAGGLGNIRASHVFKQDVPVGAKLIVLGGPALLIGLGGGSASSVHAGANVAELDFASVQRSNPEIQRRCQEVIDHCCALGQDNPIVSLHDIGAGGFCNAIPELVHAAEKGVSVALRDIFIGDPGLSPMEIWCNEAQERYVLACPLDKLKVFTEIATRERCPYAVVGTVTAEQHLTVNDSLFNNKPVNIPLSVLFAKPPQQLKDVTHVQPSTQPFANTNIDFKDAVTRVLRFPAVADKTFLITIADRTVTGLIARDQMVGPWQVPAADVGVTLTDFNGYSGEAMAMGERTPLALLNPAASARMAVAEAITNIAAADIGALSQVRLSANWMVAAGYKGDDAALFDMVKAVGMEFCPALEVAIPVGKDSMSMRTSWDGKNVIAPPSLIVTSFAPVRDARKTLTPELKTDQGPTELILIDLGQGKNRLGASVLAQVYGELGNDAPDCDPELLKAFFECIQTLNTQNKILAYHDRSDGGLFVTLAEMAFAGNVGIDAAWMPAYAGMTPLSFLFNEECGAVIQVKEEDKENILTYLKQKKLHYQSIAKLNKEHKFNIFVNNTPFYSESLVNLRRTWSETTYRMQALRDNPETAQQEFDNLLDVQNPGLSAKTTFQATPFISTGKRPKVAILREQGVNGQVEMAAAFDRAGFLCVDVHMTDLLEGRATLAPFKGLVASGGFSYGDVLGSGRGWAQTILRYSKLREQFIEFFNRTDTFSWGSCNGCQLFSQLKELIPGAEHWPQFAKNKSEQFEARVCLVKIEDSPSIFLQGMAGSILPVPTAHGEGRTVFSHSLENVVWRYVDPYGKATERHPFNPNGSPNGVAGLTTKDGRVTIVMPHPERVFRTVQNSWHPKDWHGDDSPWMQIFYNARRWVS